MLRPVSWTCRSSSPVGAGARSATRLRSSSTAVRDWPTSSCNSWATRRRSASCADSARAELDPRSASSRSSIPLNVVIRSAISPCPDAVSLGPGLSRSIVVIALVSRSSGASPSRISAAFATSRTASPATRMRISASSAGVDTVIGPSTSSATAATIATALSRKILPNKDTRAASW